MEIREIGIQKELIRQRLQVNPQKLEAAVARRLLTRRESYTNQQDYVRTTTDFILEVTSAEPHVQPVEQTRCTVDPEVLMVVDHMATAAILDNMATPETTACTDLVMPSTPQTSTATDSLVKQGGVVFFFFGGTQHPLVKLTESRKFTRFPLWLRGSVVRACD